MMMMMMMMINVFYPRFLNVFYKSLKNMFFYVFYLQINVFNIYEYPLASLRLCRRVANKSATSSY